MAKLNCKNAAEISIQKVLASFSLFPSKKSKRGAFYYAIDRKEDTPSLHVYFDKNTAHDFGTGKTYDNISIVQTIKKCSVKEALYHLSRISFSLPEQKPFYFETKKEGPTIKKIKSVEHLALITYLKNRKVYKQRSHLKEIHYTVSAKFYFGVGFKNDSGGRELRNKYSQICLGKKDITTIKNGSNCLRIFEGFFDYLSFLGLEKSLEKTPSDYLILNSIAMINRVPSDLNSYQNIELYLDNDQAGDRATNQLKNLFTHSIDNRFLYQNYKDLNDWIIG